MSDEINLDEAAEIEFFGHRPEDDEDAWITETLYRLKDGRLALHREGGMNSDLVGGIETTEINVEEARQWMQEHAPDRIEEVFGAN